MADSEDKQNKTIFLLGAGASVDTGIPDTYSFVDQFYDYFTKTHPELKMLLRLIIDIREKYNTDRQTKKEVDVEQLLDTLRRLIDREKDPAPLLHTEWIYVSRKR